MTTRNKDYQPGYKHLRQLLTKEKPGNRRARSSDKVPRGQLANSRHLHPYRGVFHIRCNEFRNAV